jgi:tRNA dimethylallyltransferase
VGYREFYPWLRGEITFQEAVDKAKQHTRNYAKRQFTWYKKQKFDLTIDIKNLNLYLLKEKIDEYLNKGD